MRLRVHWAAAIATLLGVPSGALAQQSTLYGLGTASEYSLAIGDSLSFPEVIVSAPPNPAVLAVAFDIIGGCGVVGTTANAQVSVSASSVPGNVTGAVQFYGEVPPFVARAAGNCTLRVSFAGQQRNIKLHVYDPQTLTLQPLYPLVAVAERESTTDAEVRVVDAGGNLAGGKRVHYAVVANCSVIGLVETTRDVTSDSDGVARMPSVVAGTVDGHCPLQATLMDNGVQVAVDMLIFNPATAILGVDSQPLQTITGETFNVTATLRDSAGDALPRQSIAMRDSTAVGGAGIAATPVTYSPDNTGTRQLAITDAKGQYRFSAIANAIAGRYELVIGAAERDFRIPVVQSVRGQAPPPIPSAPTGSVQDLWWAGASESGWGVSIVQHGDTLFSVIYSYDYLDQRNPQWHVMPGGTWDATHTRYSGALYVPMGTPFHAYDASKFVAQTPYGFATLIFTDTNHVTLDLSIEGNTANGAIGRKALVRQAFGNGSSTLSNLTDMWWGGTAQNGWGISLIQQAGTLFAAWFTYGDDGRPTWFVMPGGTWTSSDTYEGHLYQTYGSYTSDWIGVFQSPNIQVSDMGPCRLHFNSDSTATFEYTVNLQARYTGTLSLQREAF